MYEDRVAAAKRNLAAQDARFETVDYMSTTNVWVVSGWQPRSSLVFADHLGANCHFASDLVGGGSIGFTTGL